jgi:XTP/dITP diphosphohydrolase
MTQQIMFTVGICDRFGSILFCEHVTPRSVQELHQPAIHSNLINSLISGIHRFNSRHDTDRYSDLIQRFARSHLSRRIPATQEQTNAVRKTSIVLATGNENKIKEHLLLLADRPGSPAPNLIPQNHLSIPDVDETQNTLPGNAALKAYSASALSRFISVSDDTGLFIDVLDGRPGVYTARYAGPSCSNAEVKAKILSELENCKTLRTATFRTVAAVSDFSGTLGDYVLWVQAESQGFIVTAEPEVDPSLGGWGLDPIFAPSCLAADIPSLPRCVTLADVSVNRKLEISHRAKAFTAMRYILAAYLAGNFEHGQKQRFWSNR